MDPEPASGMDAPVITAEPPVEEPTAEEKQACADAKEDIMLQVQASEANWALDDRLDWLRLHGA